MPYADKAFLDHTRAARGTDIADGDATIAAAQGARLQHVKPHGALYNMAARDDELADAIARAVKDLGGDVMLYALAGSAMIDAAMPGLVTAWCQWYATEAITQNANAAQATAIPATMRMPGAPCSSVRSDAASPG